MAFPDSKKKAPNVFFNTTDSTGAPSASSSVAASNGIIVINAAPHPSPTVFTLYPTDTLNTLGLSFIGGTLEVHDYVTSVLYPTITSDIINVNGLLPLGGYLLDQLTDNMRAGGLSVVSGSLDTTIAYIVYNNAITENITAAGLSVVSGSLDTTIAYIVYNNAITENITADGLLAINGSLITTIEYINYIAWPTENINVAGLSFHSGSLI